MNIYHMFYMSYRLICRVIGHLLPVHKYVTNFNETRINDIAIAMSYSSRADPGLRVAFKCLNV